MKTKLLIVATILFLFHSSILKSQQWEYVNTLQNEWLQKICTQGLDTVYIVGQNGLIAKSTNHALTWNKQYYPTKVTLNDVKFMNHETGFAVGANGTILKTIDAGVNWTQQTSGTRYNLNAIAATGLDNIWAVGDSGRVVYTNDSGNNWHTKDLAITRKLNGISFRNNTGYIVGDSATMFKSVDSGLTWASDTLLYKNTYYNKIWMNSFLSVVQANQKSFVLYGSQNNGGLPICINDNGNYDSPNFFSSFTFVNDSVGYAVEAVGLTDLDGPVGEIYIGKTLDGKSWSDYFSTTKYSQALMRTHSDISIVNDTIGYAITGQVLLKISNTTINGIDNPKLQKHLLILQNNENELSIKSASKAISSVELLTTSGTVILNEKWNDFQVERSINISGLPNGIYLVNSTFLDKSNCTTKWIKQ